MRNGLIPERDKNMIRYRLADLQLLDPCADGGEYTLFIQPCRAQLLRVFTMITEHIGKSEVQYGRQYTDRRKVLADRGSGTAGDAIFLEGNEQAMAASKICNQRFIEGFGKTHIGDTGVHAVTDPQRTLQQGTKVQYSYMGTAASQYALAYRQFAQVFLYRNAEANASGIAHRRWPRVLVTGVE